MPPSGTMARGSSRVIAMAYTMSCSDMSRRMCSLEIPTGVIIRLQCGSPSKTSYCVWVSPLDLSNWGCTTQVWKASRKASRATFQLHSTTIAAFAMRYRSSSGHGSKCSTSPPRYSVRLPAAGSGLMNTNPHHVSTWASGSDHSAGSTWGKSHSQGTRVSSPSRLHVKPWNGQRNASAFPSSLTSCVPRCRHELTNAWIPSSARRTTYDMPATS